MSLKVTYHPFFFKICYRNLEETLSFLHKVYYQKESFDYGIHILNGTIFIGKHKENIKTQFNKITSENVIKEISKLARKENKHRMDFVISSGVPMIMDSIAIYDGLSKEDQENVLYSIYFAKGA